VVPDRDAVGLEGEELRRTELTRGDGRAPDRATKLAHDPAPGGVRDPLQATDQRRRVRPHGAGGARRGGGEISDLHPPRRLICADQLRDREGGGRQLEIAEDRQGDVEHGAITVIERDQDATLRTPARAQRLSEVVERQRPETSRHVSHLPCESLGIVDRVVRENGDPSSRAELRDRLERASREESIERSSPIPRSRPDRHARGAVPLPQGTEPGGRHRAEGHRSPSQIGSAP
jgi:hypothetical protein